MNIKVEYTSSYDNIPMRGKHYHSIYDKKHVGVCDDCRNLLEDAMYEWDMEGRD